MPKKKTDAEKEKEQAQEDARKAPVSESPKQLTDEQGIVTGIERGGNVYLTPPTEAQIRAGQTAPLAGAGTTGAGKTLIMSPQEQAQVQNVLETQGAFEKVTPSEISLTPKTQFGESIPVIGGATAGLSNAIANTKSLKMFRGATAESAEEAFPMDAGTVREIALNEIRRRSFEKGISLAEAFGSFVESIPIAGSAASKYAGGLLETPSRNADEVLAEIGQIREAASTGQEKVRNGLEDPEYGLTRAREMEEDVAALEGRIKLLVITSPILRVNNDEVNKIQQQILIAKEKISRYRQASALGLTAELTGTGRTIPTDEQLFLELQSSQ